MSLLLTNCKKEELIKIETIEKKMEIVPPKENRIINFKILKQKEKEITISAIGDCTLGTDTHFDEMNNFPYVLKKNNRDFSYFLKAFTI